MPRLMPLKKRRLLSCDSMAAQSNVKAKLAAVVEQLGREITVYKTSQNSAATDEGHATSTSQNDESDGFYEFTPDDYYRVAANKMGVQFLKTRKIREAEAAARRARITKAIIRVRFPDDYILEAKFQPTETIQSLMDLLSKVVAHPELPFYIFTTPPKQRIRDMSKDFYSAGFAPGAIVYFAYDLPKDADPAKPVEFLNDDICSLTNLDFVSEETETTQPTGEAEAAPVVVEPSPAVPEPKPVSKPVKPKWFKM